MSYVPDRKVGTGLTAGGALGIVLIWVFTTYIDPATPIPEPVAAAFGSLMTGVVGYLTPAKR